MKTTNFKYRKQTYPTSAKTKQLSFKRILEMTAFDDSVQNITEHVIDSVLGFLERDEVLDSGEFHLTNDSDMFHFLSAHTA